MFYTFRERLKDCTDFSTLNMRNQCKILGLKMNKYISSLNKIS